VHFGAIDSGSPSVVSASVGAAAVPPSAIGLPKITIVGAAEGDADDAAADAVVVAFGTTLTGATGCDVPEQPAM
jgi:hypothetical protein